MNVRALATVSAAALVAAALSVPVVNAQGDNAASGTGSLSGVLGGSAEPADGDESEGAESGGLESGSLESGSLDSGNSESGSLSDLAPDGAADASCSLPGLGGSVAKFYPLFGISGIPSVVITLVTSALDGFPNLLDIVAGAGGGAALVGASGSVEGPLCTTLLGGQMTTSTVPTTAAPVTVIVDGDGTPISTVTGTAAANPAANPAASMTATSTVPTATSPSTAVPMSGASPSGEVSQGG